MRQQWALAVFVLVRGLCGYGINDALVAMIVMLAAGALGHYARNADYSGHAPAGVFRTILGPLLGLLRLLVYLTRGVVVLLFAPLFCWLLYIGCAAWGLLPDLPHLSRRLLADQPAQFWGQALNLRPFFWLLLAAFFAGCFRSLLWFNLEMRIARFFGEPWAEETNEDRRERTRSMREAIGRRRQQIRAGEEKERQSQRELFNALLIPVVERMARLDGHITAEELEAVRVFCTEKLGGAAPASVEAKIMRERDKALSLSDLALRCDDPALDASHRALLLDAVYRVAYTQNPPPQDHLDLAWQVGKWLGVDTRVRRGIKAGHRFRSGGDAESEAAALAVLGLKSAADFTMVQKARQWMLKQYDPANFTDMDEEYRRNAEERVRAINAAYETLERLRTRR